MSALDNWYDQMWRTFQSEQPDVQIVLLPDGSPAEAIPAPSSAELDRQAAALTSAAASVAGALHVAAEPDTDCHLTLDDGLRLRKRLSHALEEPPSPSQLVSTLNGLGWQIARLPANDLLWITGELGALSLQLTVIDDELSIDVFGPRYGYSDDLRGVLERYCGD